MVSCFIKVAATESQNLLSAKWLKGFWEFCVALTVKIPPAGCRSMRAVFKNNYIWRFKIGFVWTFRESKDDIRFSFGGHASR